MFKTVYGSDFKPHFGLARKLSASDKLCRVAKVDHFDNQSFNINDAGFLRNDLSQLVHAQSYQEYQLILSRLNPSDSKSLPDKYDPAQVLRDLRPRYCQSETEVSQYLDYITSNVRSDQEGLEQALEASGVSSNSNSDPAVVDPAVVKSE